MNKLFLGGNIYDADQIPRLTSGAPFISVDPKEINDDDEPSHVPSFQKPFTSDKVVFYKQHGKFTVVAGDRNRHTGKDGKVSGYLLSGPVFKRAKLNQAPLEQA